MTGYRLTIKGMPELEPVKLTSWCSDDPVSEEIKADIKRWYIVQHRLHVKAAIIACNRLPRWMRHSMKRKIRRLK